MSSSGWRLSSLIATIWIYPVTPIPCRGYSTTIWTGSIRWLWWLWWWWWSIIYPCSIRYKVSIMPLARNTTSLVYSRNTSSLTYGKRIICTAPFISKCWIHGLWVAVYIITGWYWTLPTRTSIRIRSEDFPYSLCTIYYFHISSRDTSDNRKASSNTDITSIRSVESTSTSSYLESSICTHDTDIMIEILRSVCAYPSSISHVDSSSIRLAIPTSISIGSEPSVIK